MDFFLSSFTLSSTELYTCISCLRFPSRLSKAPALIKLSTVRLFTSLPDRRVAKSVRFLNFPRGSRSRTTISITVCPTLFKALRPYRMALSETENPLSPSLMSGGRIRIPRFLDAMIYSDTFAVLSITEVIRAAINSTG